jgi:predicted RNase H-like HicB family nuclease
MSRYAVIIEKSRTGYGAYVPDLPVPAPTTIAEMVEVAAVQAPARP